MFDLHYMWPCVRTCTDQICGSFVLINRACRSTHGHQLEWHLGNEVAAMLKTILSPHHSQYLPHPPRCSGLAEREQVTQKGSL